MKKRIFAAVLLSICASIFVSGQEPSDGNGKRKVKVIITDSTQNGVTAIPTPRKPMVVTLPNVDPKKEPVPGLSINNSQPDIEAEAYRARSLNLKEINRRLDEAKRQMQVKPLRISMSDDSQTTAAVRIAFYDWNTGNVDYGVIAKDLFLDPDSDAFTRSEAGNWIRIKTIRGNGVNTPVMIFDNRNRAQLPLIVQYPIEKYGQFVEMAYYVSTHPGMVTPEAVSAGNLYVRNVLNTARNSLRQQGIFIQPKVADIAERLALVEHVDHYRFRTEYHPRIYNDVYMLYALNEGQTYRYSVSSAGAGGMVQMIPATYRMIRSRFYSVGLKPDFVEGMRDHLNASKAMLLYMQMTWNDLISNQTIYSAMENGIATQEQLMAAGYNSNPTRLALYIRRGGENWTSHIPRETKVYLQIYDSVERFVPLTPRAN